MKYKLISYIAGFLEHTVHPNVLLNVKECFILNLSYLLVQVITYYYYTHIQVHYELSE